MNNIDINDKICDFTLKKRSIKFHIILSILTFGCWGLFYFAIKFSYKYNFKNSYVKNLIDPNILPSLERDARLRREQKRTLIEITSHGTSCEKCKRWEGKILNDDVFTSFKPNLKYGLLSNAVKDGLFHKGCRHGLMTYYPELHEEEKKRDLLLVDKETGEILEEIN